MTSLSISPRVSPSSSSEEFGFSESKEDYHLAREVLADDDDPDSGSDNKDAPEYGPNGYFSCLPPEIISRIFEYLAFPDFCRAACVCKLFYLHSYDPSQLSSIDLHPHWHKVNCNTLIEIAKLMPNLTFLDIQSCDKVTGEGVRELHALRKLENLNLYRTKVVL